MNKEERYKAYKLYEYHSTKSNRELRKIFDNSNWNYNIQLFRACEEIINELQQYKNAWNELKEGIEINMDYYDSSKFKELVSLNHIEELEQKYGIGE